MTSTIEAARLYADLGWSLLVLAPGEKKPLPGRRWTRAQREQAELGEVLGLLEAHPGAGLGVVTGSVSGIAIVDVDDPAAVLPVKIPEGPVVESATPGHRHLYFGAERAVPTVANLFGQKIELRAEGSMTVLPPTIIVREYRWHGDPAQGLPPLPVEILQAAKAATRRMPMAQVLRGVLQGGRNISAARVAGFFLHRSATSEEAWVQTLGWNERNVPPLESGELRTVFDSILGRHRRWIARRRPDPAGLGQLEEWSARLLTRHGEMPVWRLHELIGGHATRGELEAALRTLAEREMAGVVRLGRRGAPVWRAGAVTVPSPDTQREAPEPPKTSTPVDYSIVHTPGMRNDKAKPASNHSILVHTPEGANRGRWDGRLESTSGPPPEIPQVWERLPSGQLIVRERGADGVLRVVGWSVPEKEEAVALANGGVR